MKILTVIITSVLSISTWAQDFRLHNSHLETVCPVRKTWVPIEHHVTDFKTTKHGVAYRAHGNLYFYNQLNGRTQFVEKRVTSYDTSSKNQIVYVHDRDLYIITQLGKNRAVRLKGNISSYQFSSNGVLGFIDDGDLFLRTTCPKGIIKRIKGNVRSYKIHNNGTFAFVDDGDLFIVQDTDNGKIIKIADRVYNYDFQKGGTLTFTTRKGDFQLLDCKRAKVAPFHKHVKHEREAQHKHVKHEREAQHRHHHSAHTKMHNGRHYMLRNRELYVFENNRSRKIAGNVHHYEFCGSNIKYQTDRQSHLILVNDQWRDIPIGGLKCAHKTLANGNIEISNDKETYHLCKSLNYRRLPVKNFCELRNGIVYILNQDLVFESNHRKEILASGVKNYYSAKDKIYFIKDKHVIEFNGLNKKCLLEDIESVHKLSNDRLLISHGREWHLLHNNGIKCLTDNGQLSIIGDEVLLIEERALYTLSHTEFRRIDWGVDRFMPAGEFLFYFKGKSMYQITSIKDCRTRWVCSVY